MNWIEIKHWVELFFGVKVVAVNSHCGSQAATRSPSTSLPPPFSLHHRQPAFTLHRCVGKGAARCGYGADEPREGGSAIAGPRERCGGGGGGVVGAAGSRVGVGKPRESGSATGHPCPPSGVTNPSSPLNLCDVKFCARSVMWNL
uniref:Uncharacterized protein n=1 Tax=Oryza punctata TaxID=4537 RepID=A0A0E0K9N4_ORYPU